MAGFSDRLRFLRTRRELSQQTLANAIRMSKSSINMYERGEREPNLEKLEEIADFFNVDIEFLIGKSDVENKTRQNLMQAGEVSIFDIPGIGPPPTLVPKPRLGTISCGEPVLALEDGAEVDMVPSDIQCDYTLICKGDSMTGARINDGDIVYIRKQEDVDNGEIACVLIDDEATLKRVYKQQNGITLVPANPAYNPVVYTAADARQIRILGKAVGFTSSI